MPAIPYKHSATTDVAWDAGANEKRLKANDKAAYRDMYAWVDPNGDPDTKGAYKFPHHMVSDAGAVGAANLRACSAGIAALNGGRGGAKIPTGDRKAVYDALAHHLKDAGKDAPELKSERDYLASLALANAELSGRELRGTLMCGELELREGVDSQPPVLIGHAAVFNQTADLGFYKERVAPGAFTRAVNEDDVRMLYNHNEDHVLGRKQGKASDTLGLQQDAVGLAFRCPMPDTTIATDVLKSIRRGDVSQCSFGFQRRGHVITQDGDGNITRTLTDVKLFDVSPVTFPAYTGTDVSVRSGAAVLSELLEDFRRGPEDPHELTWEQDLEMRARQLDLARNW
jgi:hypothetical protein